MEPVAAVPLPLPAATASPAALPRKAGAAQALCVVVCGTMPILAIMSLVPVLPQMLEHFAGVPNHALLVPMVLTLPSVMTVLFSSAAGALADRWGRRRLLIVSLIAFFALGTLPLALSGLWAILASRLVVGLAEAGILTATNALTGDYFEGRERDTWLARQVMLGPLIGSIYVLAGGALGSIDWRAPFLMYLLGLPLMLLALALLWEPPARTLKAAPGDDGFRWRDTAGICAVTIVCGLFFFLQLVQHGRIFGELGVRSAAQIGIFVTAAGIGSVAGGFLYGRIATWPLGRLLALLFTLFAVGFVGLSQSTHLAVGFAFDVVAMVGGGLVVPTLMAWVLARFEPRHRGRAVGAWGAAFSLSQFLSPALAAALGLATTGFLQTLGWAGALAALLALLCWRAPARLARL